MMNYKNHRFLMIAMLMLGGLSFGLMGMNQAQTELTEQDYRDFSEGYRTNPRYAHLTIENYIRDAKLLRANNRANNIDINNVNERDDYGNTPLHTADNAEIAQALIRAGAHVNARDGLGWTPLHTARSSEIAQILLENGADFNARNNQGRRAEQSNLRIGEVIAAHKLNIDRMTAFATTDRGPAPQPKDDRRLQERQNRMAQLNPELTNMVGSYLGVHPTVSARAAAVQVRDAEL